MAERVLVTGATGFVGRAMVRRLLAEGMTVRVAVRRAAAGLPSGIETVQVGELTGDTDWRSALAGVERVVHLAARAHILRDRVPMAQRLDAYRRVNLDATRVLGWQAAEAGVRRLVFVSTVKVSGEETPLDRPFTEADVVPLNSDALMADPYARSKLEAEVALREVRGDLEVTVIRPPLVYGPGVKANFATLMSVLSRGIPLPFGAVRNKRSLVGLDNLVDLLVTALQHPRAADEAFLVSDGEDLSTTELLSRLGLAMRRPARLVPVPHSVLMAGASLIGRRAMAQRLLGSLRVDIRKAHELLDWRPPVSVDEGLRRCAAAGHIAPS